MKTWIASLAFGSVLIATVAMSQPQPQTQRALPPRPYYGRSGGYGGYGNVSVGGGSTVAGSYATGMSNMIRAQGAYNLMTAEAAISAEQAKTLDLENRKLSTQTYFEMRKMNTDYRAAEEAERTKNQPTPQQMARYAYKPKPPRLKASQLDPVSGEIHWPEALQADEFAADRKGVEAIFKRLAANNGSMSHVSTGAVANPGEVPFYTDSMRAELDKRINQLSSKDWIDAKNFLESLAYESTQTST